MQAVKVTDLSEEQKSKMFFDYSATMRKYYDMAIDDICVGFVDQLAKPNLHVAFGEKGYVIGYESTKDNFHISGLYFYGFSRDLEQAIGSLAAVYNNYKHVTCNCNVNSVSLAEKFGFKADFVKMTKTNLPTLKGFAV